MMKYAILTLIFIATFLIPIQAAAADCQTTPQNNGCTAGLPTAQYMMLLDQMLLHPSPQVEFLPVNEEEVYKFAFRQLINPAGTVVYDAPNGQAVRTLASGSAYVTVEGYEPGWIKINATEWVQESDTKEVKPSVFAGALLDEADLVYPMAWVLFGMNPAPYPGAEPDKSRPKTERYTPVNIFAVVEVDGWKWYLIDPDNWIKQTYVGRILFVDRPEGVKGRWFAVDLYEQVLVAYEDNQPVFATLISSGLPDYPTNEGLFRTWSRFINTPMDGAEGRTDFYSVENVPYVMYYDESFALHAAYWHDIFGYRNSRGCVNLSLTDAHWIYEWSLEGGYELPWVYIYSSGQYVGE